MKPKTRFNLASLIIVMLILSLSIILMKERYNYKEKIKSSLQQPPSAECSAHEKKQCTSSEGYQGYMSCENGTYSQKCFIASLDDCRVTKNQLSAVCCKASNGAVYDCNEKTDFKAGDYVILKVNLQEARRQSNTYMRFYKACLFSKLAAADSEIPDHYIKDTAFYNNEVGCSKTFNADDFHQAAASGFVPSANGRVLLSEIRLYPNTTVLNNGQDAVDNIVVSSLVFKFEVNVVG